MLLFYLDMLLNASKHALRRRFRCAAKVFIISRDLTAAVYEDAVDACVPIVEWPDWVRLYVEQKLAAIHAQLDQAGGLTYLEGESSADEDEDYEDVEVVEQDYLPLKLAQPPVLRPHGSNGHASERGHPVSQQGVAGHEPSSTPPHVAAGTTSPGMARALSAPSMAAPAGPATAPRRAGADAGTSSPGWGDAVARPRRRSRASPREDDGLRRSATHARYVVLLPLPLLLPPPQCLALCRRAMFSLRWRLTACRLS